MLYSVIYLNKRYIYIYIYINIVYTYIIKILVQIFYVSFKDQVQV